MQKLVPNSANFTAAFYLLRRPTICEKKLVLAVRNFKQKSWELGLESLEIDWSGDSRYAMGFIEKSVNCLVHKDHVLSS